MWSIHCLEGGISFSIGGFSCAGGTEDSPGNIARGHTSFVPDELLLLRTSSFDLHILVLSVRFRSHYSGPMVNKKRMV